MNEVRKIGRHYEILGWIERLGIWGTLTQCWDIDVIPERTPGTVVTRTHITTCANYVPGVRPRRMWSDAAMAQREIREDPTLAVEIERRYRERGKR